jgi:hypothetical protein
MPPVFLEAETLLMVLKNLLRAAYDRDQAGAAASSSAPPMSRPKLEHVAVK